jgi:hypothetical protein
MTMSHRGAAGIVCVGCASLAIHEETRHGIDEDCGRVTTCQPTDD